jgi:hypothetical protein
MMNNIKPHHTYHKATSYIPCILIKNNDEQYYSIREKKNNDILKKMEHQR